MRANVHTSRRRGSFTHTNVSSDSCTTFSGCHHDGATAASLTPASIMRFDESFAHASVFQLKPGVSEFLRTLNLGLANMGEQVHRARNRFLPDGNANICHHSGHLSCFQRRGLADKVWQLQICWILPLLSNPVDLEAACRDLRVISWLPPSPAAAATATAATTVLASAASHFRRMSHRTEFMKVYHDLSFISCQRWRLVYKRTIVSTQKLVIDLGFRSVAQTRTLKSEIWW